MKAYRTYAITLLFLLCLTVSSQAEVLGEDPYMVKTFSINTPAKVMVRTSGGSISVSGHSGNEVEVRMYVKKNGATSWFGNDDNLEEALEDYNISIRKEGNTIIAESERKGSGWGNNNLSISFELDVPYEVSAKLNTSGGSIRMARIEGEHNVKTSGGSLNFDEITGYTEAHTSGGSININQYDGVMDGKTSGGSIRANNAKGELRLNTSGGSIVLEDVSGSIDARTSGGSIKAYVNELDNYLTLKTSGGSINAVIPHDIGVDLDLSGNRVNTKLSNFTGEAEKNNIEGSMNGGGIPVTMKTSGGSVNLDYHRTSAYN
ncbi:carbon monoxide dehydrogenase subunit G [Catalinimonas alkaloidigena]|uniref:DUF4097 family beta strand repeat-containing protein n=1 Tax=Catalinimonas alkaloidigena TaxID=1075417 RepID=UPI002405DBDB|nr:DUF4097 family beta strand repeat-containing protein [Catalinimonas alkaloidigena]MDF9796888.1 carbon monoxide dehydrogenase subunit G [Catalinimonas alkaloidigena]